MLLSSFYEVGRKQRPELEFLLKLSGAQFHLCLLSQTTWAAKAAGWGYDEPCSSPTTSPPCSLATNGHLPQHLAGDSLRTSLECELPKSAVRGRGMMGSNLHRPGYEFQLYQVLAESQLPYLKNGNDDSHLKRLQ